MSQYYPQPQEGRRKSRRKTTSLQKRIVRAAEYVRRSRTAKTGFDRLVDYLRLQAEFHGGSMGDIEVDLERNTITWFSGPFEWTRIVDGYDIYSGEYGENEPSAHFPTGIGYAGEWQAHIVDDVTVEIPFGEAT